MARLRKDRQRNKLFVTHDSCSDLQTYYSQFLGLIITFLILILYKVQTKFPAFFARISQKIAEPLRKYILDPLKQLRIQEPQLLEKVHLIQTLFEEDMLQSFSTVYKLIQQNASRTQMSNKAVNITTDQNPMSYETPLEDIYSDYNSMLESIALDPNDSVLAMVKNSLLVDFNKDLAAFYTTLFQAAGDESCQMKYVSLFNKLLIAQQSRLPRKRKLFCVEILVKYLESLDFNIGKPINEWTDEVLSKYDQNKTFVVMQNYLASNGTVEMFIQYVCDETDYKVLIAVFNVMNGLLVGGNEDVQNILNAELNSSKAMFINRLNSLISELFEKICYSAKFHNKIAKQQLDNRIRSGKQQDIIWNKLFKDDELYDLSFENKKLQTYYQLLNNIYRYLQLSSEGQFAEFQDYYGSFKSGEDEVNLIATTAHWLKCYFEYNFVDDNRLVDTVFNFLVEIVQGPHTNNQRLVFEFKIIEISKSYIYEVGLNEKIYEEKYTNLFGIKNDRSIKKIIKLFYSMLESNQSRVYIESMRSNLDRQFFKSRLESELRQYLENKRISTVDVLDFEDILRKHRIHEFDEDIQNAFDYFFLSKKLGIDLGPDVSDKAPCDDFNFLDFYELYSTHVEIKTNGQLQTVYFVIHPICKFLNARMKETLVQSIEQKEKSQRISALFGRLTEIFQRLGHECRMQNNKALHFIASINLKLIFIILTILLNVVILGWMSGDVQRNVLRPNQFSQNYAQIAFYVLQYSVLALCLVRLAVYVLLNFKISFEVFWRNEIVRYAALIDKTTLSKRESMMLEKVNDIKLRNADIKEIIRIYLARDDVEGISETYLDLYFAIKGLKHFLLHSDFM